MDFVGVEMALLHTAPIFGLINDYMLDAVLRFPNRFMTLYNVPEATILDEPEAAIADIERLARAGARCGVQFFSRWYYATGADAPWDGESLRAYWEAVVNLNVPVFFTLYNGGRQAREFQKSSRQTYLEEHRILSRWMEQYPDTDVTITHGLPWMAFMEDGQFAFPEEIWDVFKSPRCHLQLMVPILMGTVWEYPWKESEAAIKECVDRIGADRLMWGTDMPLLARYCTYGQALKQFSNYCDFLSDSERADILGLTAARVMGLD